MKSLLTSILLCAILGLNAQNERPFIQVLGIAQDAGYPQAACRKVCCLKVEQGEIKAQKVVSLALVFPEDSSYAIIDMSPDFRKQSRMIESEFGCSGPEAIFLSHAHIGHYSGLMFLGRESRSSTNIPCYAMPRMRSFLKENGPWEQLIRLQNIELFPIEEKKIELNAVNVRALEVPHRDEYSETIGFLIESRQKKVLYIPDIDKWDLWKEDISDWVKKCDILFLDGTFYDADELPGRDMSEIPHPFIVESMEHMKGLSKDQKAKVHFIHLNHSNPLLWDTEKIAKFKQSGFKLASEGQIIKL